MTSILGIKTNVGEESIVIAADTQMSMYDLDKEITDKRFIYKIWCGKNWALAHSGEVTKELYKFQGIMSGQKRYGSSEDIVQEIIEKAVTEDKKKQRRFLEIDEMNCEIRTKSSLDNCVEFILASTSPVFWLWYVHEFGRLLTYEEASKNEDREFEYIIIGSGSDRIQGYLEDRIADDKKPLDPNSINLKTALEESSKAMMKAKRDGATGGPTQIVVLKKSGLYIHGGRELKQRLDSEERDYWEDIAESYENEE